MVLGRDSEKRPKILTIEEIQKLIEKANVGEHPWRRIWSTALLTGMRSGELFALTWKDIDFLNRLINVNKSYNNRMNEAGFLIAIDPVDEVPQFPSWFHLGFCLSSEIEVQKVYSRVKEKNVKIARDLMKEKDHFASYYDHQQQNFIDSISEPRCLSWPIRALFRLSSTMNKLFFLNYIQGESQIISF